MRITLLLLGKTKENYLQVGIEEYLKRIKRYAPLATIVIPDLKATKKTSKEIIKKQEGQHILQNIKSSEFVILLDEKGKSYSSEEFSEYISSLEGRTGNVTFVIGGAYGFSDDVYARADAKLSLSQMTFSHQMVRLIFTEQLYRAYAILNGEPYHHK